MIAFLLGFTLGTVFGVAGLVCVAIMYGKPNYIACKFFTDEKEDEIKGQMDIFDLL